MTSEDNFYDTFMELLVLLMAMVIVYCMKSSLRFYRNSPFVFTGKINSIRVWNDMKIIFLGWTVPWAVGVLAEIQKEEWSLGTSVRLLTWVLFPTTSESCQISPTPAFIPTNQSCPLSVLLFIINTCLCNGYRNGMFELLCKLPSPEFLCLLIWCGTGHIGEDSTVHWTDYRPPCNVVSRQ